MNVHSSLSFVCGMSFSLCVAKLAGEWDWPWWVVFLPVEVYIGVSLPVALVWIICADLREALDVEP